MRPGRGAAQVPGDRPVGDLAGRARPGPPARELERAIAYTGTITLPVDVEVRDEEGRITLEFSVSWTFRRRAPGHVVTLPRPSR